MVIAIVRMVVVCSKCPKVDSHDNDAMKIWWRQGKVFLRLSGSFCGAAILQRLSHHSCACDGVPLLQDDCDDDVGDDDDITIVLMRIATYFHKLHIWVHKMFTLMTMILSLCIFRSIQDSLFLKHFIEVTFGLGLRPCQQVEESYSSYLGRQRWTGDQQRRPSALQKRLQRRFPLRWQERLRDLSKIGSNWNE